MGAIDRIQEKLSRYPGVEMRKSSHSIEVLPPSTDGFAVSLSIGGDGRMVVQFAGWHEDFEEEDDALNCFAFGLSDACRLKVESRGSVDYRWTLESRHGDQWREDSATGLLAMPFWRRKRVRYLQNSLITSD
jgi:hypothetical protein